MAHEVRQVKETLQIACIHNKSGTGATATVNDVPIILFVVKTEQGKIAYHYACACKNYKFIEETGKYKCETALGSGVSSCQIEEVLNGTLEKEGILYVPSG